MSTPNNETSAEMLPILPVIYTEAINAHAAAYLKLQSVKAALPAATLNQLCNIAYALRETTKYIEDLRKELIAIEKFAERLACMRFIQDGEKTVRKKENIKTEYCTCTPAVNICAAIPKADKSPDEYNALMNWLGIDPVLRDQGEIETDRGIEDTEVVRIHWPGFQCLLNRLNSQGIALPDGIEMDKTYTEYKLRIRKKKGVNE